ncbi:MAG: O-antigen ligase family protein [Lachnospiraceae bacterium]|nr:O-antigen ligase family protein [Lachnospiraceae bacterium]
MKKTPVKRETILRIWYVFCFAALCVIDQRRGSVTGSMQLVLPNLALLCVLFLAAPSCKAAEFRHRSYAVWAILCAGACYALSQNLYQEYMGMWISGSCVLFLAGALLIRGFRIRMSEMPKLADLLAGKGDAGVAPEKPFLYSLPDRFRRDPAVSFMILFLILCCMLSKNDTFWPAAYLLVFGAALQARISQEDRKILFQSLPEGILLGFVLIQGLAFVFRPYDEVRYSGMYANPNMNALFYVMVLSACLVKFAACGQVIRGESAAGSEISEGRGLPVKAARILRIAALILAGALCGFILLTACRSAMVAAVAAAVMTMILDTLQIRGNHPRPALRILLSLAGLLAAACITFPVVYGAVRFLPPLFHHPIWFYAEYSEEKVHSWDPWNSEKYTSMEEILRYNFGRLGGLISHAEGSDAEAPSPDGMSAIAPEVGAEDSVGIRGVVYRYFFSHLNLRGHRNEEIGVQVREDYFAPHAHDLFLQMAFQFGIPAGICFLLFACAALFQHAKGGLCANPPVKEMHMQFVTGAVFLVSILTFGLTEIDWLTGQLSFTLLFLLPALLHGKPKAQER